MFERPATTEATTLSYALSNVTTAGDYNLGIEFYSGSGATGSRVGFAGLAVKIDKGGKIRLWDGTLLKDVALIGTIQKVTIPPYQNIEIGTKTDLAIQATTSDNTVLAPAPGSVALQITGGSGLLLNADGSVTAQSEGKSTVVATVDGVASAPQTVTVIGAPINPRIVSINATDIVVDEARGRIYANIWNGFSGSVSALDPASGSTAGESLPLDAEPTVLAISDDGTRLYTASAGHGTITPIDLTSFTALTSFALPNFYYDRKPFAVDIAVQPGNPNTIATSYGYPGSYLLPGQRVQGMLIYDNGAQRQTGSFFIGPEALAWASPTRLLAEDLDGSSRHTLYAFAYGEDGLTQENAVDMVDTRRIGFVCAGDRVYGNDFSVRDANSLALVGQFGTVPTQSPVPTVYGPAVDPAAKLAFFIEADAAGGRLSVYRTDDFSLVTTRRIVGFPAPDPLDSTRRLRLVRWGAKGLAIPTPGGLFLIDDVPGL